MSDQLKHFLTNSIANEHQKTSFTQVNHGYVRKLYEKCAEECVSTTTDFTQKEKMCLTSCHSNFNRAINFHTRSVMQEIV